MDNHNILLITFGYNVERQIFDVHSKENHSLVLPILNILKGVMSKIRHHDYRSIYRWSSHNEMEMYTRF